MGQAQDSLARQPQCGQASRNRECGPVGLGPRSAQGVSVGAGLGADLVLDLMRQRQAGASIEKPTYAPLE